MKISSSDLFKIIVIMLVASVIGYFLGVYTLFAHTAYEIFYYALYYGVMFIVYFLGSWVVTVIEEKRDLKALENSDSEPARSSRFTAKASS